MKNELEALNTILTNTSVFVVEHAPEVIQQLILKQIIANTLGLGVCIMCIILGGIALNQLRNPPTPQEKPEIYNKYLDSLKTGYELPRVILCELGGIGILVGFMNLYNLLVVVFIPKIYILEYAATLVK